MDSITPGLRLSRDEVKSLCGSRLRVKQVAFLRANGIRHYLDLAGWPVVLRCTIEGDTSAAPAPAWKSNKAA